MSVVETTLLRVKDQVENLGDTVDEINLKVDYRIIEHFSENLYNSPNKAIEELIANGFDAFAQDVQVFIPGPYVVDRVLVWDDGESMDIQGLKELWWIARSPKAEGDRLVKSNGNTRKMIGKFGIGKLASYVVGDIISHICRHGNEFYVVSVDYTEIHNNRRAELDEEPAAFRTPIIQLSPKEARHLVDSLFHTKPPGLGAFFERASWTLAVVESLKIDSIPAGRLGWVVGNGMPLRPDFSVHIDGSSVRPKLEKTALLQWDFASSKLRSSLESQWRTAAQDGEVDPLPDQPFGSEIGLDKTTPSEEIPYCRLPTLGTVWGTVRLFEDSLLRYRASDNGRSHGFFIFVRDRLVNPDDDQLLLSDPSFGTFYRSQFIFHADGLDAQLLADRERLKESKATRELKLLQTALYRAARAEIQSLDEKKEEEEASHSFLPIRSRAYYRSPVNSLLFSQYPLSEATFDLSHPKVDRQAHGEAERMSFLEPVNSTFVVNTLHPFLQAVEGKVSTKSKAGQELLRALDLLAIAESLLEGYLFELDLGPSLVEDIVKWRDGLFRELAEAYEHKPPVIGELWTTSYVGGKEFEKAVKAVFEDIGFVAEHDGASGKKDVFVAATVGPESFSFTVEAKGGEKPVSNKEANLGAVARHRDEVRAKHAVLVAREFTGEAILGECESLGDISLLNLEAVEGIHGAVEKFCYPLALLQDLIVNLESPINKLRSIEALSEPQKGFNYRELLDELWHKQRTEAINDMVPYKAVWQQKWRERLGWDEFKAKLVALETLAAGRIRLHDTKDEIYLRQSPEQIMAHLELSIYGDGHSFVDS